MTNNDVKCQEIIKLRFNKNIKIKCQEIINLSNNRKKINWLNYRDIIKYLKNKGKVVARFNKIEDDVYRIYKWDKEKATTMKHLNRLEIVVKGEPHNFTKKQIEEAVYHLSDDNDGYGCLYQDLIDEYNRQRINPVITKIKPLIGDKPTIDATYRRDTVSVELLHSILNEDTILVKTIIVDLQGNVLNNFFTSVKFNETTVIQLRSFEFNGTQVSQLESKVFGCYKYFKFYENLMLKSQE